ncbi:MAG TPA: aminotransferase class V-fold PLP-dependent enzyme [Nitrospira sp.]|nr:aminotransferase class V-fold PLP-dependent enzyme [Nitrospira sp.]
MDVIDRRNFLVRSGLALGTSLFASELPFLSRSSALSAPPSGPLDWQAVRDQFPLSHDLIHLAGFFLASHPTPVREAIERHRRGLDADPIGYWLAHEKEQEAIVLRAAAGYLGVDPTEIALTDSTTMGLGLLYGGLALQRDQEILTTTHDHYSTDMSLRLRAERTGATVRRIALYEQLKGISRESLIKKLVEQVRDQTRVVAVTWVHSSTGLKLPIAEMAQALEKINASRAENDRIIFCVDGVHALGVEDFRLSDLGCDFFIAGTHKWMFGPRGTGLVWGHKRAWPFANAIIPTFHSDAYDMWMNVIPPRPLPKAIYMTPGGFHSFEHRWALDQAFVFHQAIGKPRVTQRIHDLNDHLKQGLAKMQHVTLRTPLSRDVSAGIVCFEVAGLEPDQVVRRLRERGIVASVTPYATQYARVAPGLLNSPAEIERVLKAVNELQ